MKLYAMSFGLLLTGIASARSLQYAGHSGRVQNLTDMANSELELQVQLSECGTSWFPGSDGWCEVERTTTSNIDALGNFRLRQASIRIGSSNGGTIRAFLKKKNTASYDYLAEIKLETLDKAQGMTLFSYPTHQIEFTTNDGRTLTEWNSTEFGPGSITVTRTFKDVAGNELISVKPDNLSTTRDTHLSMRQELILIPKYIEQGSDFNLTYSISPYSRSGEGVILSEQKISLRAVKPDAADLPTALTLNAKAMNYSIEGAYKSVSVDLSSNYVIGKSASFTCKAGVLNGEFDVQGQTVSVTGTCSQGKAEFYLETRFWYRNFKGTVKFSKIVNRSVCGEMTDILDNRVGTLCFGR